MYKDLRKKAFAVGFGLYLGKIAGMTVEGIITGLLKNHAEKQAEDKKEEE